MATASKLAIHQIRDLGLANREAIVLEEKEDRRYAHLKPGDEDKLLVLDRPKLVNGENQVSLNAWRTFSEENKARVRAEAEHDPVAKADAEMFGGQLHRLRRQIDMNDGFIDQIHTRNANVDHKMLEQKRLHYKRIQEAEEAAMDKEYRQEQAQAQAKKGSDGSVPSPVNAHSQHQQQHPGGGRKSKKARTAKDIVQHHVAGQRSAQQPGQKTSPIHNRQPPKQAIWNLATKRVPPKTKQQPNNAVKLTSNHGSSKNAKASSVASRKHPRISLPNDFQLAEPDHFLSAFDNLIYKSSTNVVSDALPVIPEKFEKSSTSQLSQSFQPPAIHQQTSQLAPLIRSNELIQLDEFTDDRPKLKLGFTPIPQQLVRPAEINSRSSDLDLLQSELSKLQEQRKQLLKQIEEASSRRLEVQSLLKRDEKRLADLDSSHCEKCSGNCQGIRKAINPNSSVIENQNSTTPELILEGPGTENTKPQSHPVVTKPKNPFADLSISALRARAAQSIASANSNSTPGNATLAGVVSTSRVSTQSPNPSAEDTSRSGPRNTATKSHQIPEVLKDTTTSVSNIASQQVLGSLGRSHPLRNYVQRAFAKENEAEGVSLAEIHHRLKNIINSINQRGALDFTAWDKMPLPQDLIRREKAMSQEFGAAGTRLKQPQSILCDENPVKVESGPREDQSKALPTPTETYSATGLKSSKYAIQSVSHEPLRSLGQANSTDHLDSNIVVKQPSSTRITYPVDKLMIIGSRCNFGEQ